MSKTKKTIYNLVDVEVGYVEKSNKKIIGLITFIFILFLMLGLFHD